MNGNADEAVIESIKILKARYFRYLDMKNFEAFKTLFTKDATLLFEGAMPAWTGIERAITFISTAVENVTTIHHGHMPEITRTGADSAQGIWAMDDRFYARSADGQRWQEQLHGFGHYHEDYVRQDNQWYIHRLKLTRLAVDRHDN